MKSVLKYLFVALAILASGITVAHAETPGKCPPKYKSIDDVLDSLKEPAKETYKSIDDLLKALQAKTVKETKTPLK